MNNTKQDQKVRENRARRAARRQGLALCKSRRRDPRALGFGTFTIAGARPRRAQQGLSLDQVEAYLNGGTAR